MSKISLIVKLLNQPPRNYLSAYGNCALLIKNTGAGISCDTTPQPGCLSGYPNLTYQVNPITAMNLPGLNACLELQSTHPHQHGGLGNKGRL